MNGTFNTGHMATKVKQSTSLEEIKHLIVGLSRNISELNNKFSNLDSKVTKLEGGVKIIRVGQVRLDRRVGDLIELFMGVPEFSFNGFTFSLLGQNEIFVDSSDPSRTLGEIDLIYSDDKSRAR